MPPILTTNCRQIPGRASSTRPPAISTTGAGYGDKNTHRGTIDTTHAWTVPPAQIAGDSEVALELEAAASIEQTPDIDLSLSCRTHFYVGGPPERGNANANVNSTAKQKTTHDKKTVKAKIGKGSKPGDELVLDITIHTPAGSASVDYKYQWDPAATAGTPGGGNTPTDNTGGGSTTTGGGGTQGTGSNTPGGKTPTEPANVTQMTIQAGTRTVKAGDTVIVPIWLIRGQGIANLNLNVTYKTAVAKTTGTLAKGNLLSQSMFEDEHGRERRRADRVRTEQGSRRAGHRHSGTDYVYGYRAAGRQHTAARGAYDRRAARPAANPRWRPSTAKSASWGPTA